MECYAVFSGNQQIMNPCILGFGKTEPSSLVETLLEAHKSLEQCNSLDPNFNGFIAKLKLCHSDAIPACEAVLMGNSVSGIRAEVLEFVTFKKVA